MIRYLLSEYGVILYIALFDTCDIFMVRGLPSATKPLVVSIYSIQHDIIKGTIQRPRANNST